MKEVQRTDMAMVAMHAQLAATAMLSQVTESSGLKWIADEKLDAHWEFYFPAAVAGLVASLRTHGMDAATAETEYNRLLHETNKWNPKASDAMHEFLAVIAKSVAKGIDFETAIGVWILANTKGELPPVSQSERAPGLGKLVYKVAVDCA